MSGERSGVLVQIKDINQKMLVHTLLGACTESCSQKLLQCCKMSERHF